jgi:hypothetical protein
MLRAESTFVGPVLVGGIAVVVRPTPRHRFQSRTIPSVFEPHLRKKSAIARFERSHFIRLFAPWILVARRVGRRCTTPKFARVLH